MCSNIQDQNKENALVLKGDRSLMKKRILVISQKRPELDLEKLIGEYDSQSFDTHYSAMMVSLIPTQAKAS